MDRNTESTPAGAPPPVVAPTSQDREAIAAEQDAAWADETTKVDDVSSTPAEPGEAAEPGVITDKPGLAAAVPPPKAGEPVTPEKPEAEPAKKPDVEPEKKPDERPAETVTTEQKAERYWKRVTEVFPGAVAAVDTPKFRAWFAGLSDADKAIAADLDKADDAVKLMGRYYDDVAQGRVKEPEPPAPPKPFEIADYLKDRNIADLKIKTQEGETTLGDMAKPDEFGPVIGAIGAMTRASEQAIVSHFQPQIRALEATVRQLQERLGAQDLAAKVPDVAEVTNDPAFAGFRDRSGLLKRAWASGDPEQRAEVIAMFKAEKARSVVADAGAGQRKTNAAKNALHAGSLRGGAPGAGRPSAEGEKSNAEQQDAAWETPIDVDGQKV